MTRHGLTLIEVLAAVVLLSIMTAALVPAITQSTMALHASSGRDGDGMFELRVGYAANAFIADPPKFGFKDFSTVLKQGEFSFDWPSPAAALAEVEEVIQVSVRIVRSADPDIDHVWMLFCSGDQCVVRWVMIPRDQSGGVSQ